MVNGAIHRLVERHAAAGGESPAVQDGERSVTYRELNLRANGVARQLIDHGLRRGGHVVVRMPRSTNLAIVLLAVLKAGGAYTWIDSEDKSRGAQGLSIRVSLSGRADQFVTLDPASMLEAAQPVSPNLPIVARPSDIACVLPDGNGAPAVFVPHATVTSIPNRSGDRTLSWEGDAGALDLWVALIAGVTAVVEEPAAATVAA